jgi:hypothetical protein
MVNFGLGPGHVRRGPTSTVDIKFQRLYCSPDMSGPRPDKFEKCLWNPIKGPDKSDGSDLLWIGLTGLIGVQYRSNR